MRHASPNRWPPDRAVEDEQPDSASRSASASSGTPVIASRTAPGRPLSRMQLSSFNNRVALSPRAAMMKSGWANGPMASRRAEAGDCTPRFRRARNRRPPADPLTDASAVNDEMARQVLVASANASAASGAGAPGPMGSFVNAAPHDTAETADRTA